MPVDEKTIQFSIGEDDKTEAIRRTLKEIYHSLVEKGYTAANQIVGYILSEDPTYITTHDDARNKIRKIARDDLLRVLVEEFVKG